MLQWVLLAVSTNSFASAEHSFNCSYNGQLVGDASCECAPEWKGQFCHQLNLGPARNGSGLDQLHAPLSRAWGGSVIYSKDDGLYHMYASEISKHCGIHRWVTNT